MKSLTRNRPLVVAVIAAAQLLLVGVGVAPQLSARLTGETYLFKTRLLDPIDPFRGAYVALDYPGLDMPGQRGRSLGSLEDGHRGAVYVTLKQSGEVWVAEEFLRERPDTGPYLTCTDVNWGITCGIESWFLPEAQAAAMQRAVNAGAYAEVKIDAGGHAALIDVREQP